MTRVWAIKALDCKDLDEIQIRWKSTVACSCGITHQLLLLVDQMQAITQRIRKCTVQLKKKRLHAAPSLSVNVVVEDVDVGEEPVVGKLIICSHGAEDPTVARKRSPKI